MDDRINRKRRKDILRLQTERTKEPTRATNPITIRTRRLNTKQRRRRYPEPTRKKETKVTVTTSLRTVSRSEAKIR